MKSRAERPRLQINARLVKERDRARARELRMLLVCGAAIVVPLLFYVRQRVEFIRVSYRVERLARERQDLQEINKQLTVERSLLLSPDRIDREARRVLGLAEPAPQDVRRVTVIDGRIDEIGGPVAAAPAGARRADDARDAERSVGPLGLATGPAAPRDLPEVRP